MAANSIGRRFFKRILFPLINERTYQLLQCLAMAWDIRSGNWAEPELELIPFAVRAGETVLDVGANYGLYSYHLSHAVGPSGCVYAFEPVPFTCATLRLVSRLLRLRNVEITVKGCADRADRVAFRLPVQRCGAIAAGLAHMGQRNDNHEGKEEQVRWDQTREVWCDLVALDSFLPPLADVSFIKCDVEGAELLVFRGAERLITQHRPSVLCEINPWHLNGFGFDLEELLKFFFVRGYRLYKYEDRDRRLLLPVDGPAAVAEDNYLFVHSSRRDRFAALLRAAH